MKPTKIAPKWNKPHLYFDADRCKWRMTSMPGYIRGNATGRWARANMWINNKNRSWKRKRK